MNIERVRQDFLILDKEIKGKKIVYFDSSCVTLKPVQVVEKMNEYYNDFTACGGRSMHKFGKRVDEEVDNSRKILQKFFNAKRKNEIIFTKNTTEGINLVANSLDFKNVLITDKEHNSNLLPWQLLKQKGINYKIVKSNKDNTFNLEDFQDKIKGVKLVSVVHTSNLDGVTNPAKEIIKIAHENNALVMLDGAQSAPHHEINLKKLDVDFFCCSGHKMLGPSGMGMLYGKLHLLEKLKPFIIGGDTVSDSTYDSFKLEAPPNKFEAGLQNYAGIIGFGEAVKYLKKIGMKNIEKHETKLNKKITSELPEIDIIGPNAELRSGIISFNYKNKSPHEITLLLDKAFNIMTRSGAHCVHSWFNAHNMKGSVRASLYIYNTEEEAEFFIESLKKVIKMID